MKTNHPTTRLLKSCSLLAAALIVAAVPAQATALYWDTNSTATTPTKFGSTLGTWGTDAWWTTDTTGAFADGGIDPGTSLGWVTTSADVLNLNSGATAPLVMNAAGSVSAQTLAVLSQQLVTINDGGSGIIHLYGAGSSTTSAAIAQMVQNMYLTINVPIVLEQGGGTDAYFYGGGGNSGLVTIAGGITSTNSVNLFLSGAGNMTISGASPLNITGTITGNIQVAAAAARAATISSNIGANVTNVIQNGGTNGGFCNTSLILSGTNTYSGTSTANSGVLQFNSLAAIGGAGNSVTANFGGAIGFGSTVSQTDINTALSTRVVATSAGAIAVNNNLAKNFDFNTAGLSAASLGGYGMSTTGGALTYTGTYTPYGSTYRLGGPNCKLALNTANQLTGATNNVIIYGFSNIYTASNTAFATYVSLGAANDYGGETTINSGMLVLGASGTINNTTKISIAAGAGFDVSAKASGYTWSGSTALNASGTGTTTATSAIIRCLAGQAIALGAQPITLNLAPGLSPGDTAHPALYVSSGNLSLGGNQFTVNASAPLANGTYRLIQVGNGTTGVITDGGGYPAANGTALTGMTGSISVSSGNVILTVTGGGGATAPAAPTITSITPGNAQLSVAFTAGSDGGSAITSYKYSTDGGATFLTRQTGTTASPLVITTASSDGTTPLANGTSYNIQIKAVNAIGDGTATASTATTPQSTYGNWMNAYYPTQSDPNRALTADPDSDGQPNFLEFALDSNPSSGSSLGKAFVKMATVGVDTNVLTLSVAVRDNAAAFAAVGNNQEAVDAIDSLTYLIEASTTLTTWGTTVVTPVTGTDATTIQASLPSLDSDWSYKTFRTAGTAGSPPANFIRVMVTTP